MFKDVAKALASWWVLIRYRKSVQTWLDEKVSDVEEVSRYAILFLDHDLVVIIRDQILGKIAFMNAVFWVTNLLWLGFVCMVGMDDINPSIAPHELWVLAGAILGLLALSGWVGMVWPRREQEKVRDVLPIKWKRLMASARYYRERAVFRRDQKKDAKGPEKPKDLLAPNALGDDGVFGPNGRMTLSLLLAPIVSTGIMTTLLLVQMNVVGVTGAMGYFSGLFQGTVMGVAFFLAWALNKLLVEKGIEAGNQVVTACASLFSDGFAKPLLNLTIVGVEEEESERYAQRIREIAQKTMDGTEKFIHHYAETIFSGACVVGGFMIAGQHAFLTLLVCAGYLVLGVLLPHMLPRKEGRYDMWKEFVADTSIALVTVYFVMQLANAIGLASNGAKATPMRLFNRLASECNNALVADLWRGLGLMAIAGVVFLLTKTKEKEIKTVPAWIANRVHGGTKVTVFLVLFGAGMRLVFNDPRIPYMGNGDGALSGVIPNEIRLVDSPQRAMYDVSRNEAYRRMYGTDDPPEDRHTGNVPRDVPPGCVRTSDPRVPIYCPDSH